MNDQCAVGGNGTCPPGNGTVTITTTSTTTTTTTVSGSGQVSCFRQCQTWCFGNNASWIAPTNIPQTMPAIFWASLRYHIPMSFCWSCQRKYYYNLAFHRISRYFYYNHFSRWYNANRANPLHIVSIPGEWWAQTKSLLEQEKPIPCSNLLRNVFSVLL